MRIRSRSCQSDVGAAHCRMFRAMGGGLAKDCEALGPPTDHAVLATSDSALEAARFLIAALAPPVPSSHPQAFRSSCPGFHLAWDLSPFGPSSLETNPRLPPQAGCKKMTDTPTVTDALTRQNDEAILLIRIYVLFPPCGEVVEG